MREVIHMYQEAAALQIQTSEVHTNVSSLICRTRFGVFFSPVTHYGPLFVLKLGLVPFALQHWLPSGLAVSIHASMFAVIA